jgi:trimeric autotransporter adhesin
MALTATDLFNDATTREIGGVGPDQVNLIVSDLIGVQQMLSAADPQINNLTDLHTHVIINQLNEEIAAVENANSPAGTSILGTDLGQFVGRAINDIHRDIIDIAQGDQGVQALFNPTPLPPLNTPAAPFLDNAAQTAFVTQWIQDSNHLGQAAITIENNGFTGDIAGLVQQIQAFENNSNAFDQSQGGLWSARFWNEFRSDGTAGTAANALIEGLQTHNAGEVNAAAEQLAANSADVGGNNLKADGGSYADVVAAAQATAVTPAGGSQAAGDQGGNTSGNQAAGDQGGNTGGNQAAGDQGGNTSGNQAAGDQGGNNGDHGGNTSGNQAAGDHGGTAGGNQATADHGANSLVADLTALFEGGGQNSVSAVLADISALAHGAGVHGNGVATLLADLLTGAGASAQSGGGAPAASADSGHGDPSPAVVQHAGFEHMWHHG